MKYYVETSLENFEAWSGGRDTLEVLIDKGLCDTAEACLEEILDGDASDTYINDILWMERDMIAEWCGFSRTSGFLYSSILVSSSSFLSSLSFNILSCLLSSSKSSDNIFFHLSVI